MSTALELPEVGLAERRETFVVVFEDMKAELVKRLRAAKTPHQIKDVGDMAAVAEAFAVAHKSEEHILLAQEIGVHAARKAGGLRAELTRSPGRSFPWGEAARLLEEGVGITEVARRFGVSHSNISYARKRNFFPPESPMSVGDFDELFEVTYGKGRKWQTLSVPSDKQFSALVQQLKETGAITVQGLVRLIDKKHACFIERNIWRLPNGRYLLKWQKEHQPYQHAMPLGATIDEARLELKLRRGDLAKPTKFRGKRDLSALYELVHQTIDVYGDVRPTLKSDERADADELHRLLVAAGQIVVRLA